MYLVIGKGYIFSYIWGERQEERWINVLNYALHQSLAQQ